MAIAWKSTAAKQYRPRLAGQPQEAKDIGVLRLEDKSPGHFSVDHHGELPLHRGGPRLRRPKQQLQGVDRRLGGMPGPGRILLRDHPVHRSPDQFRVLPGGKEGQGGQCRGFHRRRGAAGGETATHARRPDERPQQE